MNTKPESLARIAAVLGFLSDGRRTKIHIIATTVAEVAELNRLMTGTTNRYGSDRRNVESLVADAESAFRRMCAKAGLQAELAYQDAPDRPPELGRLEITIPGSHWDEHNPLRFELV